MIAIWISPPRVPAASPAMATVTVTSALPVPDAGLTVNQGWVAVAVQRALAFAGVTVTIWGAGPALPAMPLKARTWGLASIARPFCPDRLVLSFATPASR